MQLFAPIGCYIVGYYPKKLNSVDPKWWAASKEGIYIGSCAIKDKVGYALLDEGGAIYYCVSARLDMTYFPYRNEGDRHIADCQFLFKNCNANNDNVEHDDNCESAVSPPIEPTRDAEKYGYKNDERFTFEEGTITHRDVIGCKVNRPFLVNEKWVNCGGEVTGMGICTKDGTTLIEVIYDDSDKEDMSYKDFLNIKLHDQAHFMGGLLPRSRTWCHRARRSSQQKRNASPARRQRVHQSRKNRSQQHDQQWSI